MLPSLLQKRPTESIEQYNARIANLRGGKQALNDQEVATLGYKEGDRVPGLGTLRPDGTFYDPNQLSTIKPTPPVLSSKDNAQEFMDNSRKLDTVSAGGVVQSSDKSAEAAKTEKPAGDYKINDEGRASGDPVLDSLNKFVTEESAKFKQEAEDRKAQYNSLFKTSLAALDASVAATINNITSSYDKRIKEQERINRVNIDRVKAYGLSEGGRFTPISYGDAVSNREQEAADKVSELENQRNSLIAQAKAARDQGESKLLREKLDDLGKVDEEMRRRLDDVAKESERQYQLLRDIRKEEEKKHQEKLKKATDAFRAIAGTLLDEYGKTPEEKDKFVKAKAAELGISYAEVYSMMEGAVKEKATTDQKAKEDALDLEQKKYNVEKAKADASKAWADAATKQEEKKLAKEMKAAVPTEFENDADFKKKKAEFVKRFGVDGKQFWDAVFYDKENEDYDYPSKNAGGGETNTSDPLGIL